MKIFVDIPVFRNDKFKVSAIKAIRSLSYPVMSIMDAKTMVETPGWHRIPNDEVAPLGKTKHDLINFVESYALDYSALSDAIHDYGAIIVFHNHNTEPAGYKPPTPTVEVRLPSFAKADKRVTGPEPLPPTPKINPDLDSAGLRLRPRPPKPLTQEQMNSMHVVFAILDHAIREAVSLGKYDEIPDIAKAAAFLLTLTKTKE